MILPQSVPYDPDRSFGTEIRLVRRGGEHLGGSRLAVLVLLAVLLTGCAETPIDLGGDPALSPRAAERLARMPLFEVPAGAAGDRLVVLYTGDNGWAAFDKRLAADLAQSGAPVVAVSSLRYFLQGRSPAEGAKDLAAVIDHYSRVWRRGRVVLVGYSYGGDTLPLIAQGLSGEIQAKVSLLVLISPSAYGDLTFRGASLFDLRTPDALPIAPALAKLKGVPRLCIRADRDPRAVCGDAGEGLDRTLKLPGGHHYEGQEAAVAGAILAASAAPAP
jgi:type IV secretory pathway VirJ component